MENFLEPYQSVLSISSSRKSSGKEHEGLTKKLVWVFSKRVNALVRKAYLEEGKGCKDYSDVEVVGCKSVCHER